MRIRPEVVRLYKAVHSWTGLVCGLLLFIAFYAGALTMFNPVLANWAEPPHPAIPLSEAPALIDHIVATRPEAREALHLYVGDSHAEPRFYWWDPETGAPFVATRGADGRLVIGPPEGSRLARSIDLIHRAGGLPIGRDASLTAMGVVALLYFVAILSGLIIVLRSLARDLFALRVGRNLKRMWLDAHNVVGVVSLPFHIFIAVTTAAFAFDADISDLQDRFVYRGLLDGTAETAMPDGAGKPAAAAPGPAPMLPPGALIARVRAVSPGFEAETITYSRPNAADAEAFVVGRDPADLSARNAGVQLDATTGRILDDGELPRRGNAWNAMAAGFSALHFGTFGGTPVRWAYFLLALAGAFLFYSGNLLWIESRRKRAGSGKAADRAARLMAAATVGVAFGCIAGLSLSIAAAKWLPGLGGVAGWHSGLFHAGLAAALLAAFGFGAARSTVRLMAFAAAATAAIPLTSLAGALVPASGIWNTPGALGVDLVAAAGALALAWGARTTRRRLALAPPESVWARRERGSSRRKSRPMNSETAGRASGRGPSLSPDD